MRARSRTHTADVTITVDLGDFDDEDIRAEAECRGINLGVDLDDLRRAIRKGSFSDVCYAVEQALPGEFAGLYESVILAMRRAA